MSEEYGNADLVRNNGDAPKRAESGSKPKSAKIEALSFHNLKDNISKNRIGARVSRYNREYAKLRAAAKVVNEGRKGMDEEKVSEAEVKRAIDAYNKQAEKLARIGAKIISFDDRMQLAFVQGGNAKAIRVPGTLMTVVRGLTKAGRLQNDLERAIASKIAENAEKAVGQKTSDALDVAAINKLDLVNAAVGVKVATGVIAPPSNDANVKDAEKDKSAENEDKDKEVAKAAAAKKVAEDAVKEAATKKKGSDELKGDYSERRKKQEQIKDAINYGELFDVLNVVKGNVKIGHVKLGDGKKTEVLVGMKDGKTQVIKPADLGIDDEKEARRVYNENLRLAKLAHNWDKTFAKKFDADGKIPAGAYDEDRRKLFSFVFENVVEVFDKGLPVETIVEKAKSEFTEEEVKLIDTFMTIENVNLVKAVIDVINEEVKKDVSSKTGDNSADAKKAVVDETVTRIALNKYGKKKTVTDGSVKGNDDTPVVEPDKEGSKEITGNNQNGNTPNDDSLTSKLDGIVGEIAKLTNTRAELERLLGDRAKDQLANIDRLIAEKLAQIDELTNVESLGNKTTDKEKDTPENVVSEENINTNDEEVDLEHADDINWWMNMSPILDDPDQELLSRMNVAAHEREEAARRAQDEIDRRAFEERRAALIAGDKERRRERFEANNAERSRAILGHILSNGQRVYPDEVLEAIEDPVNELDLIRENAPNAYNEAEAAYWQEVRDRNRNNQGMEVTSSNLEPEIEVGREEPVINDVVVPEADILEEEAVVVAAGGSNPPTPPGPPSPPTPDSVDDSFISVAGSGSNPPVPPSGEDNIEFTDVINVRAEVAVEEPRENIEYIMDLINNGGESVYEDNVGVLDRAYFEEHPELYDEMSENYAVPAGPEFWNLVAQGMNPITNTNALVEGIRHDRRAEAARDFLDFAYCLDEETLNAMANGEQERTPLEVVNSLPKEEVLGNLEQYGRYLEARRERIEAKRDEARGSSK